MKNFTRKDFPWFVFWVVLTGALFRMAGLFRPLLGNFSQYQTGQAMMAKFFVEERFANLLYPKLNMLVQGEPGLHLIHYPLSSLVTAVMVAIFGGEYGVWGRFQAVVFFALAAIWLYRLVRLLCGEEVARNALIFFIFSPLTLIYGQSFQTEMITVFSSIFFIYHLFHFLNQGKFRNLLLSSLSLSAVFLVRPNALYLILPALYLCWLAKESGDSLSKKITRAFLVFLTGSVIPLLWFSHVWRLSYEVSNIYQTALSQLMLRSSFASPMAFSLSFYQEIVDVLAGITLTPIGFTLFIIGCLLVPGDFKKMGFFIFWCFSFTISSLLIPRKLVEQNFYLLHFVVPASAIIGFAFNETCKVLRRRGVLFHWFLAGFLAISFGVSLRYGFHPAFKATEKERYLLYIAKVVEDLTQRSEAKIVVQGSYPLLYYSDRYGWGFDMQRTGAVSDYNLYTNWEKLPEGQWRKRNEAFRNSISTLEYLREYEEATHFVVTDPADFYLYGDFANHLRSHYPVLKQEEGKYIIFDLR